MDKSLMCKEVVITQMISAIQAAFKLGTKVFIGVA